MFRFVKILKAIDYTDRNMQMLVQTGCYLKLEINYLFLKLSRRSSFYILVGYVYFNLVNFEILFNKRILYAKGKHRP